MKTAAPRLEPLEFEWIEPESWHPPAPPRRTLRLPRRWVPIVAIIAAAVLAFFAVLYGATPVTFAPTPETAGIRVHSALQLPIGRQVLLLPGVHRITATAPGHHDLTREINVLAGLDSQLVEVELTRTPGRLTIDLGGVSGAMVRVDGGAEQPLVTPLTLPAGRRELQIRAPRHLPRSLAVDIIGMGREQDLEVRLTPGFGTLEVTTTPVVAQIWLGSERLGSTDAPVDVDVGNHLIELRAEGFRTLGVPLTIRTGETTRLPQQTLEPADARLSIRSSPAGASVTVDGSFKGLTPLELAVRPLEPRAIEVYLSGHEVARRSLTLEPEESRRLDLDLTPVLGRVGIDVSPENAVVLVDGKRIGMGDQQLRLPSRRHELEVRLGGHAPYRTEIVPRSTLPLALEVRLMTLEEARWARLPQTVQSGNGDVLRLFRTGTIEMGAPRRQPGRRRNEVERRAEITRGFYLATREVTNAQFRRFRPDHNSGFFRNVDLNGADQPVARVDWEAAALYCNWLSEQEGLDPVYRISKGELVGFDAGSIGYRLPTEAEWSFATRRTADGGVLIFPWGDQPTPPRRAGNLADRSAAYMLPDTLRDYGDGFVASAPVATFPADARGLHDIAGNVAEWINDFYGEDPELLGGTDPLGPPGGEYHVIRGSSWQHGTIVEMRTTFRDYGIDGRPDVGFRVARYAE